MFLLRPLLRTILPPRSHPSPFLCPRSLCPRLLVCFPLSLRKTPIIIIIINNNSSSHHHSKRGLAPK